MAIDVVVPLAETFKLLGDPTRLRAVLACLGTAHPVGTIADQAGLPLASASHHLQLLKRAGLVRSERRGRQVFYSVADAHISDMLQDMLQHTKHCRAAR